MSGVCTILKFTESDRGRAKDVVFTVEGGSCGDCGLTQTSTPKKGASGNCPDGSMVGIGEVNAAVQSREVLDQYWSM